MPRNRTAAASLAALLVACSNPDQVPIPELNDFAERFLVSVRDDTPFHLQYLDPADSDTLTVLRPLLSEQWRLRNWDGPFILDEGIVCLADGSLLHFIVDQHAREISGVRLAHFPHESCPAE